MYVLIQVRNDAVLKVFVFRSLHIKSTSINYFMRDKRSNVIMAKIKTLRDCSILVNMK